MDCVICGKDPGTVDRKSCSRELTLSFKQPVPIVLCLTQIIMLTAKCSMYLFIYFSGKAIFPVFIAF